VHSTIEQHKLEFTRSSKHHGPRRPCYIDRESSGWLPEYCEYVKAVDYKEWEERGFKKWVREFLPPYDEIELDTLLGDMYGALLWLPRLAIVNIWIFLNKSILERP
jgi:hypothetical protein